MLKIIDLNKRFWWINVINNLSFSLKPNSITALIWPNWSWKTTLFNCISNVVSPDSGKILFNDIDITNKPINYIANLWICRLFQHTQLCENLTVLDNLLLWFENEGILSNFKRNSMSIKDKESIIKKYIMNIWLEEKLNIRVDELSYWQQRLVEFIRLLLKPTKLMLLDEPTAWVHSKIKKYMIDLLKWLKKQWQTILLIEHDLDFVLSLVDYVIVMDEGKLIYNWTPDKIKDNSKVIDSYLWK